MIWYYASISVNNNWSLGLKSYKHKYSLLFDVNCDICQQKSCHVFEVCLNTAHDFPSCMGFMLRNAYVKHRDASDCLGHLNDCRDFNIFIYCVHLYSLYSIFIPYKKVYLCIVVFFNCTLLSSALIDVQYIHFIAYNCHPFRRRGENWPQVTRPVAARALCRIALNGHGHVPRTARLGWARMGFELSRILKLKSHLEWRPPHENRCFLYPLGCLFC